MLWLIPGLTAAAQEDDPFRRTRFPGYGLTEQALVSGPVPRSGSSRVEPDARSGLGGLSPCPQPYPLCPLPCSLRDKHVASLRLCPRDIWEVLAKGGGTFGVPGPRGEVWDDCPLCVHPRKGQLEDFIYSSERV